LQPFWTFFCNDLTLWSAGALIFVGANKGIPSLHTLISCNLHGGNFSIFFTSSQTSVLQDHTVTCVKKNFKNLVLVLEMEIFGEI